jgi:hypothetical protein
VQKCRTGTLARPALPITLSIDQRVKKRRTVPSARLPEQSERMWHLLTSKLASPERAYLKAENVLAELRDHKAIYDRDFTLRWEVRGGGTTTNGGTKVTKHSKSPPPR